MALCLQPFSSRKGYAKGIPMFKENDILMCNSGKYNGRKVEVKNIHADHTPTLYTCRVMTDDKEIALFEHELETLFYHDMRMISATHDINHVDKWNVTYEDLQAKAGRRPFWKNITVVEACTRKKAIEEVTAKFSPPKYGNYRASKVKVEG